MSQIFFSLLLIGFILIGIYLFRFRFDRCELSDRCDDRHLSSELLLIFLCLLFLLLFEISNLSHRFFGFLFFTTLLLGRSGFRLSRLLQSTSETVKEEIISRDKIRAGVSDFCDGLVREVMVPLNDVFKISSDFTVADIIASDNYCPYSRIPVYQNEKDNVIGLLYVKEILQHCHNLSLAEIQNFTIKEHIVSPIYVPEVMETSVLLQEFQRRKIHMAIVVDEYGVITGIVTFEDLMEIIVGEIQDMKNDNNDDLIEQLKPTEWVIDAMMDLDDFSEMVGHNFTSEFMETTGGFVFEHLGILPQAEQSLVYDNFEFQVLEMDTYRLRKIKVSKLS